MIPPLWVEMSRMASVASKIYTDGSKSSYSDVGDYYAGTETSKSSAGVALYHKEANEFTGIHITGLPSMTNSFMTEMVALALGARLAEAQRVVVHSDCAAALASLRLRQAKKVKMSPYWQLGMLLDLESAVASAKVKAHPERHLVKIVTLHDRGITAADQWAGSPKGAALVVSTNEVLQTLVSFSKLALVHLDTGEVAIANLHDMQVEYELARYLEKRDEYRALGGRPTTKPNRMTPRLRIAFVHCVAQRLRISDMSLRAAHIRK